MNLISRLPCCGLHGCFIPHLKLSLAASSGLVMDYEIFGNTHLPRVRNRLSGTLRYDQMLAKYTHRSFKLDRYWWVPRPGREVGLLAGDVGHVMEVDVNQEIYGIPDYVASLNSVQLNESATLFRRRFYESGCHAGVILHISDALQNEGYITAIITVLQNSKGPGNFSTPRVARGIQ